MLKNARRKLAL
ncbi:hypothetical protein GQ600_5011 [Phytophthora cactorum]|nr:hypothetical protein GQ600_5011 [Phytophthora cactorum]